jgi:hypothetical protein
VDGRKVSGGEEQLGLTMANTMVLLWSHDRLFGYAMHVSSPFLWCIHSIL